MERKEREWIKAKIGAYYYKHPPSVVELEKREFGIGDFGRKIVRRHIAFKEENFRPFLIDERPLYISHSTAYYERPDATPMEKKGFIGADLVFDLDAETSFREVVKDTLALLERLEKEFGVKGEVNFSGNRGFHVHVRDREFLGLLQEERKEIVEYLTLSAVDWGKFFWEEEGRLLGPSEKSRGIGGLLVKKVLEMSRDWEAFSRSFRISVPKEVFVKNIRRGNWSLFASSLEVLTRKVERIAKELSFVSLNIDSGVTYDVSKLIRVPDSIHGSTGFIAKRLSWDEIEGFNPYTDAHIEDGERVWVVGKVEGKAVRIKPWSLTLRYGEKKKVEGYKALYLILKGYARLLQS